ncbi:NUDIX hydrolase [Planococcus sp. CAU13]|uniref:NUDIX hydrolase n=1 Tax=Planococcus sp. CAU13 TaxID=1541197 RepID=UPI001F39207E|nr:NUDIX domain-containing protein [Planococcus sp. CAU13]
MPRANTLGILYKNNHILLEEIVGKHSRGTGFYYRPIGGTIQFGERSSETIKREFHEELAAEVEIKNYITCLENIFKIEESIGHEITQVYEVAFTDSALYRKDCFQVIEGNRITYAKWISIDELTEGRKLLYPEELIGFL